MHAVVIPRKPKSERAAERNEDLIQARLRRERDGDAPKS